MTRTSELTKTRFLFFFDLTMPQVSPHTYPEGTVFYYYNDTRSLCFSDGVPVVLNTQVTPNFQWMMRLAFKYQPATFVAKFMIRGGVVAFIREGGDASAHKELRDEAPLPATGCPGSP